jgi:ATP-dependent Clp protease ATP-binding subunit ClpC
MFERYTESARRSLFFARYEASQTGSRAIETEHVLLGLLRQVRGIVATVFDEAHASSDEMRGEINRRIVFGERFPTSIEIPFSAATKRVLERRRRGGRQVSPRLHRDRASAPRVAR